MQCRCRVELRPAKDETSGRAGDAVGSGQWDNVLERGFKTGTRSSLQPSSASMAAARLRWYSRCCETMRMVSFFSSFGPSSFSLLVASSFSCPTIKEGMTLRKRARSSQ